MGLKLIIGGAIIICASFTDAKGTVETVVIIITILGLSWLAEKIVFAISKDHAEWIKFVGLCTVTIPAVKLLKLSMGGFYTITDSLNKIQTNFHAVGTFFDKLATLAEKITFWN